MLEKRAGGTHGAHLARSARPQRVRGLPQSAARRDDVVDDEDARRGSAANAKGPRDIAPPLCAAEAGLARSVSRSHQQIRCESAPVLRATSLASSAAGLKPRRRKRLACKGIGATANGPGPTCAAASRTRRTTTALAPGSSPAMPGPGYLKR